MSDLQCPATVVFSPCEALASSDLYVLEAMRLAGVFVASSTAADPNVLGAAARLAQHGCPTEILEDVVDGASLRQAVDALADLYRGETIVVLAGVDMIGHALGATAAPGAPITVAVDSSGWSVIGRRAARSSRSP